MASDGIGRREPRHGGTRRGASGQRRALLAVWVAFVAAVVASVAIVPAAEPASAGVYQVFSADAAGDLNDQFVTTDALFAYVLVDIQGGRVCVTDEDDTRDCDSPVFGGSNTVFGIGTQYILIAGPPMEAGTFRLRGEQQNPITKEWVEQALSEPFTVRPCVGAECASTIGADAAAAFKASAGNVKEFTDATCLSYAVSDVVGAKGVHGKVKALGDAEKEFAEVSPSFGASIGAVGGGIVLNFVPTLPTNQLALKLLKQISCMASQMYRDIAADPPDPAFGTVAAPVFGTFPDMGTPEAAAVAAGLDAQEAYGRAALHAFERYQGALAANDQSAVRRQARAAAENARLLVDAMRSTAKALRAHAVVLAADPETAGVVADAATKADLTTVYQRVAASGFNADELAQLASLDYTAPQIDIIREHFTLPIEALPTSKTLAEVSLDLAAALDGNVAGVDLFAREAAAVADNDQPPLASFTTQSLGGRTVRFTSTSSSPDGDPIALSWAFGDGTTGTGATVDHTYANDGTFTATLTVDEPALQATASATVTVAAPPDNVAPVASFVVSNDFGAAPLVASFDASASRDPDGTITSYAWDFGDGASGTGVTVSHTYTAVGSFTATLVVTDDDGANGRATWSVSTRANQPPSLQPDFVAAAPIVAFDALGNDVDSEGDELTLVATTQPEHGSVACLPKGGCLYTATSGYAGPDGFDYTATDGKSAPVSAHVSVTVTAPAVVTDLIAVDDVLMTVTDTAASVDVLANDGGSGALELRTSTQPVHGTVECQPTGLCRYTPVAGFAGFDGFEYEVADGSGVTRGATVHITVAASASLDPAMTGTAVPPSPDPGTVVQGGAAAWTVGATPNPAGTDGSSPGLTSDIDVTLSGTHAVAPGGVTTAPGWSVAANAAGLVLHPGQDALLGESVVEPLPEPARPISQGTGGDGHVPILVGSKVYAFFHHLSPAAVTCIDRATGQRCPGYPRTLDSMASDNIPGPGAVVGTRIYTHLHPTPGEAYSLYCWDTATAQPCGLVVLERNPGGQGSAPVVAAGKIWALGASGRLHCVDPATNMACAVPFVATGLGGPSFIFDIVTHGPYVYVASSDQRLVACVDATTAARCAGWPSARSFPLTNNIVNRRSPLGVADGVCVVSQSSSTCIPDGGGPATVHGGWTFSDGYYNVTQEAEAGTRTLWGSLYRGGLGCWDWTTMALCTGGSYAADGWLDFDVDGQFLPSAYGATFDGSCALGLGDPGLLFTVSPMGSSPCTGLGTGARGRVIDLRTQRCDASVGNAAWRDVRVLGADLGSGVELVSLVVSVRDAVSGELLATREMVGTGGTLDLSGVSASAHPAVMMEATAISPSGNPAWADSIPPRLQLRWVSDPAAGCFRTTTVVDCTQPPTTPLAVVATIGGRTRAATLTLLRSPECPSDVNTPPTASAQDRTTAEDVPLDIVLTGGDADGDTLTFAIATSPAHGTLTGTGSAVTYTPATNYHGPDAFTFTVSDGRGGSATGTVTITVRPVNDGPTLSGARTVTVPEGSTTPLGVLVTDVDSSVFTHQWTPATGLNNATLAAPTFAAVDDGTFPFAVTVCDDATPAACSSLADASVVTVTNVTPTVDAVARVDATSGVARTVTLASFTDPGTADTHTATIDWGDGSPLVGPAAVTGSVGGTHIYATAGSYTITVCVTDDDGGRGCDTTTADVANPSGLPRLSITDASVEEGNSGTATMAFRIALDVPSTRTVRVAWTTSPGTATPGTDTLTYPEDYRTATGTATIPAGAVDTTARVVVAGDIVAEGAETLFVDLSAPVEAVIADGHAIGRITEKGDVCTILGTSEADVLVGTDGRDVLCGFGGNDTYDPRGGDDEIIDPSGSDTLTYESAPGGVVVDLAKGRATGWGTDTFKHVEKVIGSDHADTLDGDDVANVLDGRGGADRLSGWGGNDTLHGGEGDDALVGGFGRDVLDGGPGLDRSDGGPDSDACAVGDPSDVRISCERTP